MPFHLVDTSPEESTVALVRHFAQTLGEEGARFLAATEPLIAKEQYEQLLRAITDKLPAFLSASSDADAESTLVLASHVLTRLANPATQASVVEPLVRAITTSTSNHALILKSLVELFNVSLPGPARLFALLPLVTLAATAKDDKLRDTVGGMILGSTTTTGTSSTTATTASTTAAAASSATSSVSWQRWASTWSLNAEQARHLHIGIARLVATMRRTPLTDQTALTAYTLALSSLEDEADASLVAKYVPDAATALALFLSSDHVYACDMASLKAARLLEKGTPSQAATLRLTDLMLAGNAVAFDQALKTMAPPTLVSHDLGLSSDAASHKAKLMAVIAVCSTATPTTSTSSAALAPTTPSLSTSVASSVPCAEQSVSYAALGAALGVHGDEVESWVIRAKAMQLVEVQLDQVHERVHVKAYTHRTFGVAQWKELQAKLTSMKKAVREAVQAAKLASAPNAPLVSI